MERLGYTEDQVGLGDTEAVRNLVHRSVVAVEEDANLEDVARLMRENHVGDVVVVEIRDGKPYPIGMITDRDLALEIVGQSVSAEAVTAGDIMMKSVSVARENDNIFEIIKLMNQQGIARLPIISEEGDLIGIVTARRLLQFLIEEMHELATISERQREKEIRLRH